MHSMGAMATLVPSLQCDDYHYVPERKYDGGDCYFHFKKATVMITIMFASVTIPNFLKKLSRKNCFDSTHNVFTRVKLSLIRHFKA